MACSVSELARYLKLPHQGDGDRQVSKVSGWEQADSASLVFLQGASTHKSGLRELSAACVIAPRSSVRSDWNAIISDRPKLDFARAAKLLYPHAIGNGSHHPTATISPDATVGSSVDIGPYATVQSRGAYRQGIGSAHGSGDPRGVCCRRTMHASPRSHLVSGNGAGRSSCASRRRGGGLRWVRLCPG